MWIHKKTCDPVVVVQRFEYCKIEAIQFYYIQSIGSTASNGEHDRSASETELDISIKQIAEPTVGLDLDAVDTLDPFFVVKQQDGVED